MNRKRKLLAILSVFILLLASCSTLAVDDSKQSEIKQMLSVENYDKAIAAINAIRDNYGDPVLFNLDMGMISFYSGEYDVSLLCFHEAEQQLAENRKASVSEGIGGAITNDYAKAYAGEGYEDLYTTTFNALSYYKLGKFEDALVAIRQAEVKLRDYQINMKAQSNGFMKTLMTLSDLVSLNSTDMNRLIRDEVHGGKEVLDFHGSAFSTYLSMILYREAGKYDDARVDYDRLAGNKDKQVRSLYLSLLKESGRSLDDVKIPWSKTDIKPAAGKERVNFISFDGIIHAKEEAATYAVMGLQAKGGGGKSILHKVSWPVIKRGPQDVWITSITVECSDGQKTQLGLLEDVTSLAQSAVAMSADTKFLGSFYRGAMKMATAVKTADVEYDQAITEADKLHGLLRNISYETAAVAYMASLDAVNESEYADLRMGMFFPNRISAGGFDLAAGTYDFTVTYTFSNGAHKVRHVDGVEIGGEKNNNIQIISCAG